MTTAYEPLPGGKALADKMAKITDRAFNLAPAFLAVIKSFRAIETARFDANGPGWLPLAPSTVANRERNGSNPDQILQDTGVLLASLQGGAGAYTMMSAFMVEVGTTVPYAHWHQTGGFRTHASGAGWPPQRKIVDVTEKTAAEWGGILESWVMSGIVLEVV